MQLIVYVTSFIIGAMLGSFFTLAVHRLPLKQNITYKRSCCPNCNHALGFLDLFPIISYIILKGQCRYCKQKIKARYLVLEILSGIVFLLLTISFKIDIFSITIESIIHILLIVLFVIGFILMAGIDKTKNEVPNSLMIYEYIIAVLYMIYLCILEPANSYKYVIYFGITFILILISVIKRYIHIKIKVVKDNNKPYIFYLSTVIVLIIIFCNFIFLK